MINKREAELKTAFSRELRHQIPGAVTIMHSTTGAPDRAITFGGHTTYLEFKHGTPVFDSPGIQELCCARLEATGSCRYVIWQENANGIGQRTLIVRPRMVMDRGSWNLVAEETFQGFDHKSVVLWLRRSHNV